MALRSEYDAIIVGAGHNGLIPDGYMVRAGLKVVVLECYLEQGGGLDTHVDPHYPGFNAAQVIAEDLGMVPWCNPISLEDHLSGLK